jgi:hypothetical protein
MDAFTNLFFFSPISFLDIKYTGWIPKQCDCSDVPKRRRLVDLTYNPDRDAHGVTHHGATFNLTQHQRDMIMTLRDQDRQLYSLVKEIFAEQVEEVEGQYGITICDKFREVKGGEVEEDKRAGEMKGR